MLLLGLPAALGSNCDKSAMCDRVLNLFPGCMLSLEKAVQMYHHNTFTAKINLQKLHSQPERENTACQNLNKRHHISILAYFRT